MALRTFFKTVIKYDLENMINMKKKNKKNNYNKVFFNEKNKKL